MMYAKAERLISNSETLPAPRASVYFKSVSNTAGYHITTTCISMVVVCVHSLFYYMRNSPESGDIQLQ